MSIGKTNDYSVLVIGSTLFQPQKQRDRSPTCFDKKWFSAKCRDNKYIFFFRKPSFINTCDYGVFASVVGQVYFQ